MIINKFNKRLIIESFLIQAFNKIVVTLPLLLNLIFFYLLYKLFHINYIFKDHTHNRMFVDR